MPEISFFYGIKIFINYSEHNPPHFHAEYGEYQTIIYIDGWIIEGKFPKRALKLVLVWAKEHKEEILENWFLSQKREQLKKIKPLK
ncbi:MAG TPA: DUF4160 domain-containing protein [Candidatus Kapabacteria bacterium]|nr:DUF4160 domain-containing protein [Candidatus Kapabacteria bacterium]